MRRMSGVFYRELGFSLETIAEVSKVYGFAANMVGVFLGGVLAARIGVLRALFVAGFLTAATNLTYSALAVVGQQAGQAPGPRGLQRRHGMAAPA